MKNKENIMKKHKQTEVAATTSDKPKYPITPTPSQISDRAVDYDGETRLVYPASSTCRHCGKDKNNDTITINLTFDKTDQTKLLLLLQEVVNFLNGLLIIKKQPHDEKLS